MQAILLPIVTTINAYLSDYILVVLLAGMGLFFSFKTKFIQIRCFGEGMRSVFGGLSLSGGKQESGMTSFQSLTTAVAAQVGTGSIIGASGAILVGGPGSIFWMWIISFLGMATIYSEAVLAQETRVVNEDGSILGGPVYYIRRAYKGKFGKFLAGLFAVAITLALGFAGCMVQSNSISEACARAFGIPGWVIGIVLTTVTALILFGGVSRIASVTEKLVPIMAIAYLAGGILLLIARIKVLPETIGLIFKYAFYPNAIIGGSFGAALKIAVSQGVKRGLFASEAGMGSTPHAHAQAKVSCPHDQGVVAMTGVFIDIFLVLNVTAFAVISTLYAGNGPLASGTVLGAISRTNMAQIAFGYLFGKNIGNIFVATCLVFFAFSTIIGWNFFGRINIEYLFGKKAVPVYTALALVFIMMGSCLSNVFVWELTDMLNNIMVIPNAFGLVALVGLVQKLMK